MAVVVAGRVAPRQSALWRAAMGVASHFLLRRFLKALATIFLVSTLIFFLVRFLPGDPVDVYINQLVDQYGFSYADASASAAALFAYDPDQPLLLQYLEYLRHLAQGDLGESLLSPGTSVTSIILEYLPWTLFSVGVGLLLAFVLGVGFGMLMAYRRGSILDNALSAVGSVLHSVPNYLFAIMVIVFFGVRLPWLPVTDMRGALSPGQEVELSFAFVADALYHAALPIATYTLTGLGTWMLLMKSSTLAALDEDFVTAARARGLSGWRIATVYVGRNAILPLFAQVAIAIGFVVGGSFLVEPIFSYQGIGFHLFRAIQQRDYPMMQGIFLLITISVVMANFFADLLYSRLDPRIRTGTRSE